MPIRRTLLNGKPVVICASACWRRSRGWDPFAGDRVTCLGLCTRQRVERLSPARTHRALSR